MFRHLSALVAAAVLVAAGCDSSPSDRLCASADFVALKVTAQEVGAALSAAPAPAVSTSYLDDQSLVKTHPPVQVSYEPLATFRAANAEAARKAAAKAAARLAGKPQDDGTGEKTAARPGGKPRKKGFFGNAIEKARGLLGASPTDAAGAREDAGEDEEEDASEEESSDEADSEEESDDESEDESEEESSEDDGDEDEESSDDESEDEDSEEDDSEDEDDQ